MSVGNGDRASSSKRIARGVQSDIGKPQRQVEIFRQVGASPELADCPVDQTELKVSNPTGHSGASHLRYQKFLSMNRWHIIIGLAVFVSREAPAQSRSIGFVQFEAPRLYVDEAKPTVREGSHY